MRPQLAHRIGTCIVVVALAASVYIAFFKVGGGGFGQGPERRVEAPVPEASADLPDDGSSLRSTYRTINLVQKHYIDPTRIDPRAMLLAAMRAVQESVAEVIVREDGDALVVGLGAEERRFALGDVGTPWILLQRIREIFAFMQARLSSQDVDFQEIEYAAINGMLERLDPHTSLLPPDVYRDMKDKTQGNFGGLGIVISIRDGVLTVISPLDGTPAAIAGLKAGDQVLKIGEASTVSMPLNDAVNLMRGEPGTKVSLTVLRKEWAEAREFVLTRAIIEVKSVETKMFADRVGYARIKDFQANTAADLEKQLADLERRGATSLVLDLRNNPGGLLTAANDVSDVFLKKGVIVTTAGQGPDERDSRRAADSGREPTCPVVVLINSGSASASEIVAGALKNNGRALLVGQRTFGKGSVQVLYDFADGSALKLTTAQYLTPGDISIQSIGVVPHVELLPMRADEEVIDLKVDAGYREADLDRHFEGDGAADVRIGRPDASLLYLWKPERAPGKGADGEEDDGAPQVPKDDDDGEPPAPRDGEGEVGPDTEIDVARDLAAAMAGARTSAIDVEGMRAFLERRAERERGRLVESLRGLGVDWRVGEGDGAAAVSAAIGFAGGNTLRAGEKIVLEIAVTNLGPKPLYRLLATTRSDFRAIDDREIAFGRVGPSETVKRTLEIKVPKDALARVDDVIVSFEDAAHNAIAPLAARFAVLAKDQPRFAYGAQMNDTAAGNGDGLLQKGERVSIVLDLENVGAGKALDAYATLASLSGNDVFLTRGREKLGEVERGARRQVVFEFEVRPAFQGDKVRLELAMMDADLHVYVAQRLEFPLVPPRAVAAAEEMASVVRDRVPARDAPAPDARIAALLPRASVYPLRARVDGFARLDLGDGHVGWVLGADVAPASAAEPSPPADIRIQSPPAVALDAVAAVVTRGTVRISGRASDSDKVRDVYIFVGDEKVFFKANTDPANPGELSFAADVALEPGMNFVTVVAEESAELDARRVIAVRRDRVDGMPFIRSRSLNGPAETLGVLPSTRP
ncbi:MAG: S41 family peptidase [Proteobacteria bacterium]|jgi:carboxyl-terminal processing protease|nr:S41 family peptidase [Pseudomonadota bacterium]